MWTFSLMESKFSPLRFSLISWDVSKTKSESLRLYSVERAGELAERAELVERAELGS